MNPIGNSTIADAPAVATPSRDAVTAVPIEPLFARRWSTRAFDSRPLAPGTITALLEAARWAPSSMNEQPWRLVVVTHEDPSHAATVAALAPSNQVWASRAPLLIVATARTAFARNGNPNRHAWHDTGLATAQLVAQATGMNLAAHIMGGFDHDAMRAALEIPADAEPVSVVAVGHPAAPESLPADLRDREALPRVRKPLGEIAFTGRYGRPFEPAGSSEPPVAIRSAA